MAESITSGAKNGAASGQAASAPPPGLGHNGPDEQSYRKYLQLIIKANGEMDEARGRRSAVRKQAKAAGIELKKLDAMVTMMEWEPGEVRDHFRTLHQYAAWTNLPIYTQGELFAELPAAALPALDWDAKGFMASTTGKGVFGQPPDDCPAANIQDWMKGWTRGQEANAEALKERPTPIERAAAAPDADAGKGEEKPEEDLLDPAVVARQAKALKEKGFVADAAKPKRGGGRKKAAADPAAGAVH